MKRSKILAVGALSLWGSFTVAQAQTAAPSREDRRAQRQQQTANMSPEQRQQYMQQRRQQRVQSMSPEQRQRMQQRAQQMQQNGGGQNGGGGQDGGQGGWNGQGGGQQGNATAKADQMRAALIAAGILDTPVQDDIIAFVLQQEKVRASLLQVAQTAAQALIKPTTLQVGADGGNEGAPPAVVEAAAGPNGQVAAPLDIEVANAEVERTLGAYEEALTTEKERYAEDLKDLDTKVGYSTTPRIKSFLALIGVLNFESYALGGPEVIFAAPNAGRGRGGRGQRQAMNGQGQNGQWQNGQGQPDQGPDGQGQPNPQQPNFE